MAFKPYSVDGGHVPSWEELPASALVTPVIGKPLALNEGVLQPAFGTAKPTHICMCEREIACNAGDLIPVIRADSGIVFETEFSENAGAVNLGDKVTISADGMGITATTAGGVCEIVSCDGTDTGDKVRIRF